MKEQEILQKVADSFTDKPKEVTIPIAPKNWFEKMLMQLGLKEKSVTYQLRKILFGNRERIAPRAKKFANVLQGDNIVEALFNATLAINEDLIYITAVALQNDRNEPSKTLLDQLKWVDDSVFADILDKCLSMIDFQSFLNSIALIHGEKPELIKTSLNDTREMIARGEKSTDTEYTSV